MFNQLAKFIEQAKLLHILWVAFVLRLIAVCFSKGYAFSDDHFTVIEPAQAWLNGLPYWIDQNNPPLHSMLYAAAHTLVFLILQAVNIYDPQLKMLIIRLLHAILNISVVYLGYKITLQIAGMRAAKTVAWLLAFTWIFVAMSVRNLVEMVCIPFFLAGLYYVVSLNKRDKKQVYFLLSGVLFGLAFSIRYHTALIAAGMVLVLLAQRQIKGVLFFAIGFVFSAFLLIGLSDIIFFDYPFQSVVYYYQYNATHSGEYPNGAFYKFFLTVIGYLLPPISLALIFGAIKGYKQYLLLFASFFLFFVFHSLFPNKQERFILPVLPLLVILGTCGWYNFVSTSKFWQQRNAWIKNAWIFFIVINTIILLFTSVSYNRQTRTESMYYFYNIPDVHGIIAETYQNSLPLLPFFYTGKPLVIDYRNLHESDPSITITNQMLKKSSFVVYPLTFNMSLDTLNNQIKEAGDGVTPNYLIFYGTQNLDNRIQRVKQFYPNLQYRATIGISFLDKVMLYLNPKHYNNESCVVYKIN